MSTKILVATPIRSFGELIAQALQEVGYYPLLVADVPNALTAARDDDIALVVLDCAMPSPGSDFLAAALHEQKSNLHLLLLPSDGNYPQITAFNPQLDIRLPQPFYLPDLLTTIERLLPPDRTAAPAPAAEQLPPAAAKIPIELAWLQDSTSSARYLDHFLRATDAQAILVLRSGKLLTHAGELPRERASELAHFIARRWKAAHSGDLALFTRLPAIGEACTLYAVSMGSGFVLGLVFSPDTLWSDMRAQAHDTHARLTSPLPALSSGVREASVPGVDSQSEPDDDPEFAEHIALFEQLLEDINPPDPDGRT